MHTVLIESAHRKPSIFPDWLYLYYHIRNPIPGGLFEPPFWVRVCGTGGGEREEGGGRTAPLP